VIDAEGYRLNVGIMVVNAHRRLLMGKRVRRNAWQFPQGGIDPGESPQDALWRELYEELGFERGQMEIVGCTRGWLHYRLPQRFLRDGMPQCIGQKQKWFMLRLLDEQAEPCFDRGPRPEFDAFRWVPCAQAAREVVAFKRPVYDAALRELGPMIGLAPKTPGGRAPVRQWPRRHLVG
jgi:putative (di)nucleoside polyphosphate hydrolase